MLIESKIQRPAGTKVELDGIAYHFRPGHPAAEDASAHVEDVEDDAHIGRFLSITEGFRLYRPGRVAGATARREAVPSPASIPLPPSDLVNLDAETRQQVAEEGVAPPMLTGQALLRRQTPDEQAPSGSGPAPSPAEGGQVPEGHEAPEDDGDDADQGDEDGEGEKPAEGEKPEGDAAQLDGLTRDELEARYFDLYGKKPHNRLGDARLRELLAAGKQD